MTLPHKGHLGRRRVAKRAGRRTVVKWVKIDWADDAKLNTKTH